jgi:hypothetical protein
VTKPIDCFAALAMTHQAAGANPQGRQRRDYRAVPTISIPQAMMGTHLPSPFFG